jgi:hypothetical protein
MHLKECYISKNGISCITNVNSLINLKDINLSKNNILHNNLINKNNLLFFILLRGCEFLVKDIINNKSFLIFQTEIKSIDNNLLNSFIFS